MDHIPIRVWQERRGEISWQCSCGCLNKHFPLPADLECGQKHKDVSLVHPAWWYESGVSQTSQYSYQLVVTR